MQINHDQLEDVGNEQGVSTDDIVQLMYENEKLLKEQMVRSESVHYVCSSHMVYLILTLLQLNLKQTFVFNVAKALITSNSLQNDMKQKFVFNVAKEFITSDVVQTDMIIDDNQLPTLLTLLQLELNLLGLKLDKVQFSEMARCSPGVGQIAKVSSLSLKRQT
jgi:hypothetical protein